MTNVNVGAGNSPEDEMTVRLRRLNKTPRGWSIVKLGRLSRFCSKLSLTNLGDLTVTARGCGLPDSAKLILVEVRSGKRFTILETLCAS